MVRETVGKTITRHLKQLFDDDVGMTFDYVAEASGVSKPTANRVYHGHSMHWATAKKLAEWIECESSGNIKVQDILNDGPKKTNYSPNYS